MAGIRRITALAALTAFCALAAVGRGAARTPRVSEEGRLVARLATAIAEYPAIVTGVVPITEPLLHPEQDLEGRWFTAPRHWVTAEGFRVDREPCAWDVLGRAVAYRVALPLRPDPDRSSPERRVTIHESETPGRASLEPWTPLTSLPRAVVALELCGGGTYRGDLIPADVEPGGGAWSRRLQAWRRLEPEAGGGGPILGVHSYVDVRADGIVLVEMRLSNGAVGHDGSGAQGTVFFEDLRVEVPKGWTLVWDATGGSLVDAGGTASLVAAGTGPFAFDARRQTIRRFALCRPGRDRRAGRVLRGDGFARSEGPCSYYEGGWGNRGDRIPNYDRPPLRSAYNVDKTLGWRAVEVRGDRALKRLVGRIDGARPENKGRTRLHGLFHPAGSPDRGEQGGWLIESAPGSGRVARNWMRHERLLAYQLAERMPVAFDSEAGSPITAAEIARAHGGVFPYEIHLTGAWWYDKHELPWWRELDPVGEERKVPVLYGLRRWAPIDAEHYGRAFTTAYAWALQTGDLLAADLVREAAARVEMALTLEPTTAPGVAKKPEGWWADLTLGARLRAAEAERGRGVYSTRDLAWAIECMVAAYRLTPPSDAERRHELERWLAAVARYLVLIQTPSGICEARRARKNEGSFHSTYSPDPFRNGVSPDWAVAQWLEESLRVNACGSLVAHLHDEVLRKALTDNIRRTSTTMLTGMRRLGRKAPPKWVGVKPGTEEVLHPDYGGESFQSQSALWVAGVDPALIYRMHGDGTPRGYVIEICRVTMETAPDMLGHAVPILADIVNDER